MSIRSTACSQTAVGMLKESINDNSEYTFNVTALHQIVNAVVKNISAELQVNKCNIILYNSLLSCMYYHVLTLNWLKSHMSRASINCHTQNTPISHL